MVKKNQELENVHGSHAISFLAGMLIGGLAGIGTALLLAPQSGEDTRLQIQDKSIELRDQTAAKAKEVLSQVRVKKDEIMLKGQQKADELLQKGKDVSIEQFENFSEDALAGKKAVQAS